MTNPEQQPKSIDQRLEAITETLELVAGMQQVNEQHITKLRETVEVHEQERQRLRRAMRAALEAYLDDGSGQ